MSIVRRARTLALVLPATAMLAGAPHAHADETVFEDRLVLTLAEGVAPEDIGGLPPAAIVLDYLPEARAVLVGLPDAVPPAMLNGLVGHPAIDDAEFLLASDPDGGQTQGVFYDALPEWYPDQYAWDRLHRDAAHRTSLGVGVTVAILDTGVDASHPALLGAISPHGVDLVDDDEDPDDSADGVDQDGDGLVDELRGHGTMVAGLVRGLAPGATILPVRVLDDDGGGTSFDLAAGILRAVDLRADVICLSLGFVQDVTVLESAIAHARAAGAIVVAAAGNHGADDPVLHPAALPGVIAVAGTDVKDRKVVSSSYGPHVDLSAPGAAVVSCYPGGRYASAEGTSLATGLVAGAAALLRGVDRSMPAGLIELRLRLGAVPIDARNPEHAGLLGRGRLDAAAALEGMAAAAHLGGADEQR